MHHRASRAGFLARGGLLLILGIVGPHGAMGETPAPEEILKGKGLTSDQRRFVLDEGDALSRLAEVDKILAEYKEAAARRDQILGNDVAIPDLEERSAQLRERIGELKVQLQDLSAANRKRMIRRYNSVDLGTYQELEGERARTQEALNQAIGELRQRRSQQPRPADRKAIFAEFDRLANQARSGLDDLKSTMDAVLARHRTLAADAEVKSALAAVQRATKVDHRLGPSARFDAAYKRVEKARASLASTVTEKATTEKTPRKSRRR